MTKVRSTRQTFEALVASITDPALRVLVSDSSIDNAFDTMAADGIAVSSDLYGDVGEPEFWTAAIATARMILDDPAGYA